MRKSMLLVMAAAVAVAIAIGALVGGTVTGNEVPSGIENIPTDGPRNFVVNVTDAVDLTDRG